MFDNEEAILPNDFEEESTSAPMEEEINATEEVTEETPSEETSQEQTETVEQPKIRVKYNHEEKELTLEEATLLAQKGMNYDKTMEKFNALQNDPGLLYLNELATRNNMTVSDLVGHWKAQEEQQQLNELIQSNIPEEYAREMLENRKFREQFQAKAKQEEQMKTAQAKQEAEINEFLTNYPEIDVNKIPQEVWELKKATGKSLNDAMMQHENQELKKQIKILKQNDENKKKAPVGSLTGHGSTETASDDEFLKGFNSI